MIIFEFQKNVIIICIGYILVSTIGIKLILKFKYIIIRTRRELIFYDVLPSSDSIFN